MCGICGFVGEGDAGDLRRMNRRLIHRGPDGEGAWIDRERRIYLGHRRLAIIDIEGGRQPMWTADGDLGVLFNGEIYNHRELRGELEGLGHVFSSDHSDTEALLYAYRQWGGRLVERLNGMWAFAIYDRPRRRLFLSRDRFGQKPLFYAAGRGLFAFASELKALIEHPGVVTSVSRPALKKYFAYGYVPAPHTIYERVHKLPAGYNLTVDTSALTARPERYWDFVLEPVEHIPADAEEIWCERLRELLRRSVSRRLMADVPLGVLVSGGIDSSSVAACAVDLAGGDRVKSFSIGFEEASFDESRYASRIAAELGTDHTCAVLSLERARDLMPSITERLDEPMGDSSLLPTYLLCEITRRNVKVALGGDAADELFAGYDPFRALKLAELYNRLVPRPVHRAARLVLARLPVSHRNLSLEFLIKRTLRGLSYPRQLWNSVWLGPLEPRDLEELFAEPCDLEDLYSEAIAAWDACPQDSLVDKTLQFYTKLYLQDDILVKVDRASMMHSLEVRSPFLDIDLVDLVRTIPSSLKYRNGITKYILKKAMSDLLPREIVRRPKKGFGVPIGKWLRQGRMLVDPGAADVYGLDRGFITRCAERHRRGTEDHRAMLWNYWLLGQTLGEQSRFGDAL